MREKPSDKFGLLKERVRAYTDAHRGTFAGRWVVGSQANRRLVVAFTDQIAPHREALPAEVEVVARAQSVQTMNRVAAEIATSAPSLGIELFSCGADHCAGILTVRAYSISDPKTEELLRERWGHWVSLELTELDEV